MSLLLVIALVFVQLGLLAIGGGNAVLPEMQRQVVSVHGWMSAQEFTALFGLAQAAPGPNLMVVVLLGWRVAGIPGAAVAAAATFVPTGLLTAAATQLWDRWGDGPRRRAIEAGLLPVTVGMVAAGATLVAASALPSPLLALIAGAVALLATTTRLHPLWLLALGALAGLAGAG